MAATTVLAGAAYAAAEVLDHIDGGAPRTVGATVEISRAGEWTRRQWTVHPGCDCRRRRRRRTGRDATRLTAETDVSTGRAPCSTVGCFN